MGLKHSLPWVGRLYRQRDIARRELDTARQELDIALQKASQQRHTDSVDAIIEKLRSLATSPEGSTTTPRWRWDKYNFLSQLPAKGRLLDVGCGNNSPYLTKQLLPDWHYIGLDIEDYNQTVPNVADEYVLTSPETFSQSIEAFRDQVDVVISSHNLEHCTDRYKALRAMAQALKTGGQLYLAFPCQDSLRFPGGRRGSLNYYDDCTHRDEPPDFGEVISRLNREGVHICYAATRYQPNIDWLLGMTNEAQSADAKETKEGTWAYWGFETIIWAEKRDI